MSPKGDKHFQEVKITFREIYDLFIFPIKNKLHNYEEEIDTLLT